MENTGSTSTPWAARTFAVLEKDVRSELRTRYALNAILLFALSSLVTVSFALAGAPMPVEVQAAVLWILIFFAALAGLSRVFVHEEERGTAGLLRLAAQPGMVFTGKFLFNLALLLLVEVILVPLYAVLMNLGSLNAPLLLLAVLLGSVGLAATGTLTAALVARARAGNALHAVLAFPLLLPVLVTGVAATRNALAGGTLAESAGELRVLVSYDVVVFTGGLLLFDFVWSDA